MKTQLLTLLLILGFQASAQNTFIDQADAFFQKHVRQNRVDYKAIKSNPKELYTILDVLGTNPVPEADRKAYLINAYNIFVIAGIVEAYPVPSPQVIPSFYDAQNYVLNHEKMSLNELEKGLLFKEFPDPGLHFVLVCGANGCPPIINRAYRTETLSATIESQMRKALNSDFIKVSDAETKVELSEIFSWYTSDFGKNNKAVVVFINQYRTNPIPETYKIGFYPYDWNLNDVSGLVQANSNAPSAGGDTEINLQTFTPGSLLSKGQADYTLFNTMYTQTKADWLGQTFTGVRETFVTHLAQVTYGISKNKRINIGLDINFRSSGRSTDSTFAGIAPAFSYENGPDSRVGITAIGARVRLQPFKAVSDFSIQSTLQLPTIEHPEGSSDPQLYWADWDRITWWNQFFYTKSFGDFQLFTEIDLLFRFKKYDTQIGMLDIPMSVFFSYFPTNKITLYAMSQHVPRLTNNINPDVATDWVIPMNYTASGLGAKYQISRGLNVELLYSNFWRGQNSGLGSTFNIGIKYITR